MFEQDYIMRQVKMLTQFIARTVFGKDTVEYEVLQESNFTETDNIHKAIQNLLYERKFCEAENLLYERLDTTDLSFLALAIDFYKALNDFSDAELEEHNFSREEVKDGLNDILVRYNMKEICLN